VGGTRPPRPFPGGETEKGRSDSLRRRLFLLRHAEVLHPSALARWRHIPTGRPFAFTCDLAFDGFCTHRQRYELFADPCLQCSVQSLFHPDRRSPQSRPDRRLRNLPPPAVPCHRIIIRHCALFHMTQDALQMKRLVHRSVCVHLAVRLDRQN
jgi:hypothetical protein